MAQDPSFVAVSWDGLGVEKGLTEAAKSVRPRVGAALSLLVYRHTPLYCTLLLLYITDVVGFYLCFTNLGFVSTLPCQMMVGVFSRVFLN